MNLACVSELSRCQTCLTHTDEPIYSSGSSRLLQPVCRRSGVFRNETAQKTVAPAHARPRSVSERAKLYQTGVGRWSHRARQTQRTIPSLSVTRLQTSFAKISFMRIGCRVPWAVVGGGRAPEPGDCRGGGGNGRSRPKTPAAC